MSYVSAAYAVFKRDLLIYRSYRAQLLIQAVGPVLSLVVFYYVSRLVSSPVVGSPDDYYAFVVVGILILGVTIATLSTPPNTLRQELLAGTFERVVLSPFGPVRAIAAMTLFPLALAMLIATVGLLFATMLYKLPLQWPGALLALPVLILSALSFLPFGLLIGAVVLVFKQAAGAANFVVSGVALVAGLYFPTELLPGWLRWMSDVQPFTPALDLLRHLLVDTPLQSSAWTSLAKVAAFAAVLVPFAAWVLSRAVELARRRGTIIEY